MTDGPPKASWESLHRPHRSEAGTAVPSDVTPEEIVWRAVSTGVGKDLLDWLRKEYIERRNRPGAPEADLRELEAQRALVHRLETMRDRGAEIAASRNKTT